MWNLSLVWMRLGYVIRIYLYVHIYIPESEWNVSSSMAKSLTPLYDDIRFMMYLSVVPIQTYLLCDGNIWYVGYFHWNKINYVLIVKNDLAPAELIFANFHHHQLASPITTSSSTESYDGGNVGHNITQRFVDTYIQQHTITCRDSNFIRGNHQNIQNCMKTTSRH